MLLLLLPAGHPPGGATLPGVSLRLRFPDRLLTPLPCTRVRRPAWPTARCACCATRGRRPSLTAELSGCVPGLSIARAAPWLLRWIVPPLPERFCVLRQGARDRPLTGRSRGCAVVLLRWPKQAAAP